MNGSSNENRLFDYDSITADSEPEYLMFKRVCSGIPRN